MQITKPKLDDGLHGGAAAKSVADLIDREMAIERMAYRLAANRSISYERARDIIHDLIAADPRPFSEMMDAIAAAGAARVPAGRRPPKLNGLSLDEVSFDDLIHPPRKKPAQGPAGRRPPPISGFVRIVARQKSDLVFEATSANGSGPWVVQTNAKDHPGLEGQSRVELENREQWEEMVVRLIACVAGNRSVRVVAHLPDGRKIRFRASAFRRAQRAESETSE